MKEKPPVLLIMGPTACGKTDLAIELVQRFPMQIVSVDSAMIYRDMDIGTAKPDAATLARAPHRLIDIINPVQSYSAAQFRNDALREIEDIQQQGDIPILVGGTMLYFKALQQGLSLLPEADAATRSQLGLEAERLGWPELHRQLAEVDPEAAARIHPNDPQRLIRALEVYRLSGRSMTALWDESRQSAPPFNFIKFILNPASREILRERIALRFHLMLEMGFEEEVRKLYQHGDLNLDMPSMRAVGYRQVWQYLQGDYDYTQMVEQGITATRQFAKRQVTWLRSEKDGHILEPFHGNVLEQALKCLQDAAIHSDRDL